MTTFKKALAHYTASGKNTTLTISTIQGFNNKVLNGIIYRLPTFKTTQFKLTESQLNNLPIENIVKSITGDVNINDCMDLSNLLHKAFTIKPAKETKKTVAVPVDVFNTLLTTLKKTNPDLSKALSKYIK